MNLLQSLSTSPQHDAAQPQFAFHHHRRLRRNTFQPIESAAASTAKSLFELHHLLLSHIIQTSPSQHLENNNKHTNIPRKQEYESIAYPSLFPRAKERPPVPTVQGPKVNNKQRRRSLTFKSTFLNLNPTLPTTISNINIHNPSHTHHTPNHVTKTRRRSPRLRHLPLPPATSTHGLRPSATGPPSPRLSSAGAPSARLPTSSSTRLPSPRLPSPRLSPTRLLPTTRLPARPSDGLPAPAAAGTVCG